MDRNTLSPDDREYLDHLDFLLASLETHIDAFWMVLSLFAFCESNDPDPTKGRNKFRDWKFIAARDGAMSIYHFGKTAEAISADLGKHPAVLSLVDRPSLRAARSLLHHEFPRLHKVRHAISHLGEVLSEGFSEKTYNQAKRQENNRVELSGGPTFLKYI